MNIVKRNTTTEEAFVSSLDLAEMLGIQHKAVLQVIRKHQDSIENFGQLAQTKSIENKRGVPTSFFHLTEPQLQCYFMFVRPTEETTPVKLSIMKDFQAMKKELETPYVLPKTFGEALHMLGDSVEEGIRKDAEILAVSQTCSILKEIGKELEHKIEIDAPKVGFVEDYVEADGFFSFSEGAKALKVGPRKLMAALRENGVLRLNNDPYQRFLKSGYFVVKTSKGINRYGIPLASNTTLVTPKGMTWLAKNIEAIMG